MTTEENILYQLLNSIRAAELNNDEVIDERELRAMMRIQRSELINRYSSKGEMIQDICFQKVAITPVQINEFEWEATVPNIIRLKNNYGMKLATPAFYNIPVISIENYQLGKFNPINKYQPKAKLEGELLTIRIPDPSPHAVNGAESLASIIACFKLNKGLLLQAILDNPDDGIDYDWTTSQYPISQEILGDLKKNLLRRDLQIILATKSDQVPNMKNDTLRYHDQGKVQQ